MSLQGYSNYKPSGIEWLGLIPERWGLRRLKFLCDVQTGDKDTVDAVESGGYPFFVRSQTVERIDSFTFDCEAVLTAGDGVGVGKVFHYVNGKFDFHQRVYMMNNFKLVSGKYFFWYLSAMFFKVALAGMAKSTVDSLRMPLFMNFPFTVPTREEQDGIVRFLDREAIKIADLIAEQQRLISLLREKRRSCITQAVTNGLDPNVEMKSTGIEWLDCIPKHWSIPKLNTRFSIELGKMLDESRITGEHLVPYLRNVDVQWGWINYEDLPEMDIRDSEYNRYTVQSGDLLVCEGGEVGRAAIVEEHPGVVGFQKALHRIRPRDGSEIPKFMFYSLVWAVATGALEAFGSSTIAHLTGDQIRRLRFPKPPAAEQSLIVSTVEQETDRIDALINEAERAIALLQERRTALISAAVTGKIDVRGAAA